MNVYKHWCHRHILPPVFLSMDAIPAAASYLSRWERQRGGKDAVKIRRGKCVRFKLRLVHVVAGGRGQGRWEKCCEE